MFREEENVSHIYMMSVREDEDDQGEGEEVMISPREGGETPNLQIEAPQLQYPMEQLAQYQCPTYENAWSISPAWEGGSWRP